ncbi:hypothetical protein AB9N12_10910 [Bacteroides sp. AN502(2024)]|uniref:hypothetical protein n=1 Tax=Bacteroides sp. AN502(2024) TaxID=3160599 RepID=UPI003518660F
MCDELPLVETHAIVKQHFDIGNDQGLLLLYPEFFKDCHAYDKALRGYHKRSLSEIRIKQTGWIG